MFQTKIVPLPPCRFDPPAAFLELGGRDLSLGEEKFDDLGRAVDRKGILEYLAQDTPIPPGLEGFLEHVVLHPTSLGL